MDAGGLFIVAAGIFALCGAGFNWDWFMNHYKARFFTTVFGRTGARMVYGILGTSLVILGILMTTGIVKNTR